MSENWNQGYFTDVGYTYGYYREINPVFQRFCLLLQGFAAPGNGVHAVHGELGFGQGVSVNIHAAANPGQYVATDFNPAQAAHANELAAAAGSGARLYDDSFEQFLERADLPQFDSISLHGIWTWVSPENHQTIVEFARRHLKPGGVFYNSYNCFPGWAPAYPLRQLFATHDRFAATPHDVNARVEAALKFAEALLAAEPAYLKAVPQLTDRLKGIMGQNRHYLAHEYFNREWNCMYFTEVADRLAQAKLDFACSAAPIDAVDAVNLTPAGLAFLQGIEHPVLREQTRDYFVNQQFRKDIFLRGASRLSAAAQRERMLDTRFALTSVPDSIDDKVQTRLGEAKLQDAIYKPVIAALAEGDLRPKTLRQLAKALPGMPWSALQQALAVLVAKGSADPCHDEAASEQVATRCQALNARLCERAQFGNEIETLASPVTGGGIPVNRLQQLFLRARGAGKTQATDWASDAWRLLDTQGQKLVKDGKTLGTAEENQAELTQQAKDFAEKRLPVLEALQVV